MSDRTKQKLIKLANQLDLEGLHEEANKVDAALQKYAQGLDLFKEEKNLLYSFVAPLIAIKGLPLDAKVPDEKAQGVVIPISSDSIVGLTKIEVLKLLGQFAEMAKKQTLMHNYEKMYKTTTWHKKYEDMIEAINSFEGVIGLATSDLDAAEMHNRIKKVISESKDAFKMLSMYLEEDAEAQKVIADVKGKALHQLSWIEHLIGSGAKVADVKQHMDTLATLFDVTSNEILKKAIIDSMQAEGSVKLLTEKESVTLRRNIEDFIKADETEHPIPGAGAAKDINMKGKDLHKAYRGLKSSLGETENDYKALRTMNDAFLEDAKQFSVSAVERHGGYEGEIPDARDLASISKEMQKKSVEIAKGMSEKEFQTGQDFIEDQKKKTQLVKAPSQVITSDYKIPPVREFVGSMAAVRDVRQDIAAFNNVVTRFKEYALDVSTGQTLAEYMGLVAKDVKHAAEISEVHEARALSNLVAIIEKSISNILLGLSGKMIKTHRIQEGLKRQIVPTEQYYNKVSEDYVLAKWKSKFLDRMNNVVGVFAQPKQAMDVTDLDNKINGSFKKAMDIIFDLYKGYRGM